MKSMCMRLYHRIIYYAVASTLDTTHSNRQMSREYTSVIELHYVYGAWIALLALLACHLFSLAYFYDHSLTVWLSTQYAVYSTSHLSMSVMTSHGIIDNEMSNILHILDIEK